MNTMAIGKHAERAACRYLKQKGLKLITKNYRCRFGEIDLIMRDKNTLIFVEVRTRRHYRRVSGAQSVGFYKRRRLITTARRFIQQHRWAQRMACRFDVLDLRPQSGTFAVNWIRHAFNANEVL